MHKEIGIDLGSADMRVCTAEEGMILKEPSVVAYAADSNRVVAYGSEAVRLAEENKNLRLYRPIRNGILDNMDATQSMIGYLFKKTCPNVIIKPRLLLGIPFGVKEEEEVLLEYAAVRAGAREAFTVYNPIAAMIGLGLTRDDAALIVDIGAHDTGLLLMAGGKSMYENTVPVGGDSFDAAIAVYLQNVHKIKISSRSTEAIKMKIGTVWINRTDKKIDVKGKNIETGEPATVRLSAREMFDAFEEPTARLVAVICEAIEKIPSAYVGEVFQRGILLCGGGACLDGLDKLISGVTGVNARVVEKPEDVVAAGISQILAELPTSMKNEKINISKRCLRADL